MMPKRIVAFGGSILFGMVDPKGGGFIGRLKVWLEQKGPEYRVYNLGISGDTTTGMLRRLIPEASIRKPDLIIITTGLNDIQRKDGRNDPPLTPLSKFEKNVFRLIAQAKTLADVIFVSPPFIDEARTTPIIHPNKTLYYYLTDAVSYTDVTKKICEAEKVPYLDIFNEWRKRDYNKLLYKDGNHVNARGHEDIFVQLKTFLMKLYK